jgi:hypothetical protein
MVAGGGGGGAKEEVEAASWRRMQRGRFRDVQDAGWNATEGEDCDS